MTMTVYHGGYRLEDQYRLFRGKSPSQHFCGPCLYFTSSKAYAQGYAKGPRKLYTAEIHLDPLRSLNKIVLPSAAALAELSAFVSARGMSRLRVLMQNDETLTLAVIINLMVSEYVEHGAFRADWSAIQQWIVHKGGAFDVSTSFGVTTYMVYDPSIITGVRPVK